MVRDLARGVAEADPFIIRRRADPNRTTVLHCPLRFPEPNVVSLPRVPPNGLFECKVLHPPEEVQLAYRRLIVRPLEHGVDAGIDIAANAESGRRIPLGR